MRTALALALVSLIGASAAPPLAAREVVEASAPQALAVSIYRDPARGPDEEWNRDFPGGFAMISEDRTVTLPAGESTIRFVGVSEGMVAVTAIVTGLPGGTIEKNRNADLLSPAALVDGTLGNRVTITRTDPRNGVARSEQAIVRTRADGGLVLQTAEGFEAVRCSGLPERLTFDSIPDGLTAQPVFTIDTRNTDGGTYLVRLTYLSWGFDWQANYVATLPDPEGEAGERTRLTAWLTLLNDNGQSFENAELMTVAGRVNTVSDFQQLADPPEGRPLRLTCWPRGSTAEGSPVPFYGNIPAPPPPMAVVAPPGGVIVVTGSRVQREFQESATPVSVVAGEEQLGDLKLYRFPEPVTVAAKGQKQVAFLQRDGVSSDFLYRFECSPYDNELGEKPDPFDPATIILRIDNEERAGLGRSIPQGSLTLFEPSVAGPLFVGERTLRDYAVGQEIELELTESAQVFSTCGNAGRGDPDDNERRYTPMVALITNANPAPVKIRMALGWASDWNVRDLRGVRTYRGEKIWEGEVAANSRRELRFRMRPTDYEE